MTKRESKKKEFLHKVMLCIVLQVASGRGGAITRGSGGAGGYNRRYTEEDDTGSLTVILVVILPVAQMIAVLAIVFLIRLCYRKYYATRKSDSDCRRVHCPRESITPSVF
ncbi:hypothetical protein B4U80_02220 [Leptotrombidium deliense]|uniref:Uncharacterized protein n=1 Tax=Leptotrombidium deliense TaxID=299467 RepID=A0A443SHX6_9ACAR|nr:hypothetical protein B4U80_02220 [Leptotrombidium deliense]